MTTWRGIYASEIDNVVSSGCGKKKERNESRRKTKEDMAPDHDIGQKDRTCYTDKQTQTHGHRQTMDDSRRTYNNHNPNQTTMADVKQGDALDNNGKARHVNTRCRQKTKRQKDNKRQKDKKRQKDNKTTIGKKTK